MKNRKKILSILIKLLIGFGSILIIYLRLKSGFTAGKLDLLTASLTSLKGMTSILLCVLLMPVNWGIESYKWQLITAPVQKISYNRASRSVYSGVCLGNFAPGRATEFIAKILFFEAANRPKVTVLHFMNGMFQFSVTVIIGFIALILRLRDFSGEYGWLVYVAGAVGFVLISVLIICLINVKPLLNYVSKKISRQKNMADFEYSFTLKPVMKLFSLSLLRYLVFFSQFALVLHVFQQGDNAFVLLMGISIYFLITATIPMLSVVEAAIRAAVALVVFKNTGLSDTVIALSTIIIWLVNIIFPSLIGYYFLLRENFNFKFLRTKP